MKIINFIKLKSNLKVRIMCLLSLTKQVKSQLYRYLIKIILLIDRNLFIGKVNKFNYDLKPKSTQLPCSYNLQHFYINNCFYSKSNQEFQEFTITPNLEFDISNELPGYQTIENVVYIPSQGLYSEGGDLIDYTYPYSHRNIIPKKINNTSMLKDVKCINTEFLYIGKFESLHYGHFLTEGISHLWGIKDYEDFPFLYNGYEWSPKNIFSIRKNHAYIDSFFANIQLDRDQFFYFSKPTRLRRVIIPNPSLLFGKSIHTVHSLLPEFASNSICKDFDQKKVSSQPVYFSRRKLTSNQRLRYIYNEDLLENFLMSKGVKIVYPESLSLDQQISIVNKYKYIIGCQGSALHNIIFTLNQDLRLFCLTSKNTWLGTYHMIDAIKSIKSQYIFSVEEQNEESQLNGEGEVDNSRNDKTINLEATIYELLKIGLI